MTGNGATATPTGSTCPAGQVLGKPHTDTLSQKLALPTLKVQVLDSSGTVLATLATYSNVNHNTGYAKRSFSLAGYAGP